MCGPKYHSLGLTNPLNLTRRYLLAADKPAKKPVHGPRVSCGDHLLDCLEAIQASASGGLRDQRIKLLRPRCIGAAVEVALAMVKQGMGGVPFAAGHVVVCTTGPPDFGPGAITVHTHGSEDEKSQTEAAAQYFHQLSLEAHDSRVTVDVFCMGGAEFSVHILRKLAEGTGGGVLLQHDFGAQFAKDLCLSLSRVQGWDGTLAIRTASSLSVSRVIGGVTDLEQDDKGGSSGGGDFVLLRLQLGAVRPDDTIAIFFRLEEDLPVDYVHWQFELEYTNRQQQRLCRVVTSRLRTTGNLSTFVRSIDTRVTSVLAAKRSVLLAATKDVTTPQVHQDLDEQVCVGCVWFVLAWSHLRKVRAADA